MTWYELDQFRYEMENLGTKWSWYDFVIVGND